LETGFCEIGGSLDSVYGKFFLYRFSTLPHGTVINKIGGFEFWSARVFGATAANVG
jgi:hypothetical protein